MANSSLYSVLYLDRFLSIQLCSHNSLSFSIPEQVQCYYCCYYFGNIYAHDFIKSCEVKHRFYRVPKLTVAVGGEASAIKKRLRKKLSNAYSSEDCASYGRKLLLLYLVGTLELEAMLCFLRILSSTRAFVEKSGGKVIPRLMIVALPMETGGRQCC